MGDREASVNAQQTFQEILWSLLGLNNQGWDTARGSATAVVPECRV